MLYTQVTFRVDNAGTDQKHSWFILASEHDSIKAMDDALAERGAIYGTRIDTAVVHGSEQRLRRETSRRPLLLGREALITVQPLAWRVQLADGTIVE
ncbi:hypothetical protein [Devosia ginsengisoli]|uniref:hypothetical protein n=1 Tax=Devosia ginsengisoli TaxID=400770 RepID=UPI0026F2EC3A|nr:hypothetical protein [Devosia ginsengisoli]MCR6673280.1 hypothetical protein [Devosia ginsengisoli]